MELRKYWNIFLVVVIIILIIFLIDSKLIKDIINDISFYEKTYFSVNTKNHKNTIINLSMNIVYILRILAMIILFIYFTIVIIKYIWYIDLNIINMKIFNYTQIIAIVFVVTS